MAYAHRSLVVGAGVFTAMLLGSNAEAADQGVTGKKLLLKSNPKMVLLSKDELVIPGANGGLSDPRCVLDGGGGLGGSVKLDDGTNSVTLNMPCANWTTNGAGTLYKYKDTTGTPKVGIMKGGLLKVVSPGIGGFPVPNGTATVNVEVTVGADKYCMTFSGTGDGDKFLVKDAAAGSCAPPCGDSAYPTCGGSCPSGQVCQATAGTLCDGCTCDTLAYTDCACVPSDGVCAGVMPDGICQTGTAVPFTLGPCAPGEACSYGGDDGGSWAAQGCFPAP